MFDVDCGGIEAGVVPFSELFVALMVWVGDCFEVLLVARGAADVLGRASADGFKEARIKNAGLGLNRPLEAHRMLPAIAEVVEISQAPRAGAVQNIDEFRLAGIARAVAPLLVRNAPARIADAELKEVAVGPAHCRLDDSVQMIEADRKRHIEAPHDERVHVLERDLQADNVCLFRRGHGHRA